MSEFIKNLDAESTSDGIQFSSSMLQSFFNDKDYLKKTKESRSTSTTDALLQLPKQEKRNLQTAISNYLNTMTIETQE